MFLESILCYNKLMSTKIMFLLHISKRSNWIEYKMLLGKFSGERCFAWELPLGRKVMKFFVFVRGRICLVNECFVYSPVDNKMSG